MAFNPRLAAQHPQADEWKRIFERFLNNQTDVYDYREEIQRMLRFKQTRLIVNLDDLRDYNRDQANQLLKQPVDCLPAFEGALKEIVTAVFNEEKHEAASTYHIGLSGSFGDHHVSPRSLHSGLLGRMVSLEGIITRCSLVRPKLVKSIHYSEKTTNFVPREYKDATMTTSYELPTPSVLPTVDDDGSPLQTEYGLCEFRDYQRISIQEMPERAPAGQLPRSIDIILDDDLVDKCKPGDRIQLVGTYRSIGGGANGAFK